MTNPSTWPPPPNTPEPLSAHDDFLIACIRDSTPKPPLSRLSLVKNLRDGTGSDLRFCLATVNSFCDRHAILAPMTGPAPLAVWLLSLVALVALAAMNVTWYILQRRHDAAITHIERVVIANERMKLDFIYLGIVMAAVSISLIFIFGQIVKTRKKAVEAQEKFRNGGIDAKKPLPS